VPGIALTIAVSIWAQEHRNVLILITPASAAVVLAVIVVMCVVSGIFAVQNFIPILLLTNGGPGTATLVPGLDMYQSAFQNDQYGYGMAIGTLLFVAMLIFTLAVMRALRPRTN
jgi:ABC-type sugar transport system permease subunit